MTLNLISKTNVKISLKTLYLNIYFSSRLHFPILANKMFNKSLFFLSFSFEI